MKNTIMTLLLLASPLVLAKSPTVQIVKISVTDEGYVPPSANVKAGVPVVLKITRKTEDHCANEIEVKKKTGSIKKELPVNKEISIEVGPLEKGELHFACGMDMFTGVINVQ